MKGSPILETPESSAFCAACGTATCSEKCHQEYLEKTSKCVYHHVSPPEDKSILSHLL